MKFSNHSLARRLIRTPGAELTENSRIAGSTEAMTDPTDNE